MLEYSRYSLCESEEVNVIGCYSTREQFLSCVREVCKGWSADRTPDAGISEFDMTGYSEVCWQYSYALTGLHVPHGSALADTSCAVFGFYGREFGIEHFTSRETAKKVYDHLTDPRSLCYNDVAFESYGLRYRHDAIPTVILYDVINGRTLEKRAL